MGIAAALLVPLLPLVLLLAAGAALARRQAAIEVPAGEQPDLTAAVRHTRAWRLTGAGLGAAATLTLLGAGDAALGRVLTIAPMALGAGVLVGVSIGELSIRRRSADRRSADLHPRTIGQFLSTQSRSRLARSAIGASAILAVGTVLGSTDDMGRRGRMLTRTCTAVVQGQAATLSGSRGPWPGSFYTIPVGIALVVAMLLALFVARTVAVRARPSIADAALDDRVRAASLEVVESSASAMLRLTAAPLAFAMTLVLSGSGECRTAWDAPLGWVLAGAAVWFAATGVFLLVRCLLGPRVRIVGPSAPRREWERAG